MSRFSRRHVLGFGMLAVATPGEFRRTTSARQATPSPAADYHPDIDPEHFGSIVNNRYWPLVPGTIFTYEGTSDGEPQRNLVTVTPDTKTILGVTCVAVRDQVFADDELLEDTVDWYAQDLDGNVWYFGEDSTSYEGDKPSKEGSWEAGVDGAYPGILMPADPVPGAPYRQEYYPGQAEDMARVLETGGSVTVPYGTFSNILVTEEWSPLEPEIVEHKTYAPGVGFVYSIAVSGENEEFSLVDIQTGTATPLAG